MLVRVMFYRDKKATDEIQIAKVTRAGTEIEAAYTIDSNWSLNFYSEKTNEHWRPMRIYK